MIFKVLHVLDLSYSCLSGHGVEQISLISIAFIVFSLISERTELSMRRLDTRDARGAPPEGPPEGPPMHRWGFILVSVGLRRSVRLRRRRF